MVIYVWIYENGAIELKSRPISKGDDIKIKRKVSPFFSFFTRLCSFHCPPFSIFCPFTWFESGVKVSLNQGEIRTIGVKFLSTMFINPDIYKTI